MSRLSKAHAEFVRGRLVAAATDKFRHPDQFPRIFGNLFISERQCQEFLRRLAADGLIRVRYHARGWYRWNTYAAQIDPSAVRRVYEVYYKQFRSEGYGYGSRNISGIPLKAAKSYIMRGWQQSHGWNNLERHGKFCSRFYQVYGKIHPSDPIPF